MLESDIYLERIKHALDHCNRFDRLVASWYDHLIYPGRIYTHSARNRDHSDFGQDHKREKNTLESWHDQGKSLKTSQRNQQKDLEHNIQWQRVDSSSFRPRLLSTDRS